MSLPIETTLLGLADLYGTRVGPTLTDSYAIEANRLAVIMLTIMGNATDDAVALRVAENATIRTLLGEASSVVSNTALAASLAEAATSADPGLRITELDREADRLRRLLIALQIQLETQADDAAMAMNQRIWRLLQSIEESRAPRV